MGAENNPLHSRDSSHT